MKKTIYTLVLACILFIPNTFFAQTTYTLEESGGNWQNPGTWLPAGVPGPGDYVIVMGKLVIITGTVEIAGFTLDWGTSAGTIEFEGGGNPSLTVTGNSTWGAGVFKGGNGIHGGNDVNNMLLFTETSVVTMTYNPDHNFHTLYEGTYMTNRGTIILQGDGGVGGRGLSTLHNEGLFDIQGDGYFGGESFSGATFINTGTLRKSGGTGISTFNGWWIFENQGGTIEVQSGTLGYSGGGSFNEGIYNVSEDAALSLTGSTWIFSGALTGSTDGVFSLDGATISTDSANVSFNIQGAGFQFVDGTITGGGTLIIPEGALFVLPGLDYASINGGTTILNQGTINMYGTQWFSMAGGTTIDNRSLFDISSDADMDGGNGGSTFINSGTLRKSGGSDVTVFDGTMHFYNLGGIVDVQTGTLQFTASGSLENGAYNIAENAVLNLKSGIQVFKGGLNVSSAGTFSLTGADMNTDSSIVTLNVQGNAFSWVRGDLTGGGTLIIPEGVNVDLTGTDYAGISGGTTLQNMGTITFGGATNFTAQYNSIFDNRSLVEFVSDNDFHAINGGGTFLNTGKLIKSGGLDVSSFSSQWKVINKIGGVIDAETGEFDFSNLENEQGGIMQGTAVINLPSNFINNGITSPGHSPGTLTYIGNFQPSETAVFNVEISGLNAGAEYDQLLVTGNAILGGALNISLVNGFIPTAGDSFEFIVSTGVVSDTFSTVHVTQGLYINIQINANNIIMVVDSVGDISSIGDGLAVAGFELNQNYPNPFYSKTKIKFEIIDKAGNQGQPVSLKVYDLSGKEVAILINSQLSPGAYEVNFDGSFLPGGIYFCKLMQGNFLSTKKMVLMK